MTYNYQARCSSELLGVSANSAVALAITGPTGGREKCTGEPGHRHPIGEARLPSIYIGSMVEAIIAEKRILDHDVDAADVSLSVLRSAPNEMSHEARERSGQSLLQCGERVPAVLGAPCVELARGGAQTHY
jgi:hypothetical protein